MTDSAGHPPLRCAGLSVGVGGRTLVDALDLTVHSGELVAVLGRNGSGKTLTLKTLSGLRAPDGGRLDYFGTPASQWKRPQLAKKLSLLPQEQEDLFPSTVLETALIGRHPHIGRWQWETETDRMIALAELARVGLDGFASRRIATLSGGERRRLAVAQTLIQQPSLYLLDEPTNHLDPNHQLETLGLFREQVAHGAAAVVSLHDVNLAVRFADRCLLLHGDGEWQLGPTAEILDPDSLERLYRTAMEPVVWRSRRLYVPAGNPPHRRDAG